MCTYPPPHLPNPKRHLRHLRLYLYRQHLLWKPPEIHLPSDMGGPPPGMEGPHPSAPGLNQQDDGSPEDQDAPSE